MNCTAVSDELLSLVKFEVHKLGLSAGDYEFLYVAAPLAGTKHNLAASGAGKCTYSLVDEVQFRLRAISGLGTSQSGLMAYRMSGLWIRPTGSSEDNEWA